MEQYDQIPTGWKQRMNPDIVEKADQILSKLNEERTSGAEIFPPKGCIYRALELVSPERVSAVIIGQDPYPTPGMAMGLSFSVAPGCKIPASLRNIYKEMQSDLGTGLPTSGDLTPWTKSGVLLLNSVLSVLSGKPDSHRKLGWQEISGEIIRVCLSLPQPVVFLLWGRQANELLTDASVCKAKNKLVLRASHPSPLGCRQGNERIPAFLGSRPFSRTNQYLPVPVDWNAVLSE